MGDRGDEEKGDPEWGVAPIRVALGHRIQRRTTAEGLPV